MKHTIRKTFFTSNQWHNWYAEMDERWKRHNKKYEKLSTKQKAKYRFTGVWDVDEAQECGWMSPEHFADFMKFFTKK